MGFKNRSSLMLAALGLLLPDSQTLSFRPGGKGETPAQAWKPNGWKQNLTRSGSPYSLPPHNRDQEQARRRRQIAACTLQAEGRAR